MSSSHADQHGTVRPRELVNPGHIIPFAPEIEIPRHLSVLVQRYPPSVDTFINRQVPARWRLMGFFHGPTSIAYGFFCLANRLPSMIEGQSPIAWARLYLSTATSMRQLSNNEYALGVGSHFCGIFSETLSFAALTAAIEEDEDSIQAILMHLTSILAPPPEGEIEQDDFFEGRSGYLFLLRFVRHYCAQSPSVHALKLAEHQVIEKLMARGPGSETQWKYLDRVFLNGHGWLENIVQILLCEPNAQRAQQVRPWLLQIIDQQLPNDNWNMIFDDPQWLDYQKDLVQIGHGAPGIVVGLWTVRPIYEKLGDQTMLGRIDQAVDRAQHVIWERGLLTKETCILHGGAGNSVALKDPRKRETFLALSTVDITDRGLADGSVEPSADPSGVLKGLMSTIWAMVDFRDGRVGVVPVFNDV